MALRIRSARKYLSVGAVAAVIVAAGLHSIITPSQQADAAVVLPASILCAPNTCNANRALDSLQDVTLYNNFASRSSGQQWRIRDENSGLADRQLIEVANQGNHYMERVVLGVYITDDLYNAMPGRQVPIRFVDRDCDTGGNPAWNIEVRTPGSATADTMASYNGGSRIGNRNAFCNTRNNSYANQTWFNLAQYKSRFQRYSGGSLWYAEIVVRITNFDKTYDKDNRNARFQVRLDNAACTGMSACRQYVALVSQDNAYDTSVDKRNFALSTRAPSQIQKKVTTDGDKDKDRDEYAVFGRKSTQKLIRQFMEFGLSCDINTPTPKTIYVYDVNDGDNAGAETHGWVGGRDIVGVVLQYYNETQNAWQLVPTSQIVSPTGSSGWSYAGSHNTDNVSPRNHYLYSVGGSGYPATVILPKDDDRVESKIRFTMMPRTKYRIAVTPDDGGNFMAVGLPGDQMYGIVGCDSYDLSPKITTGTGSIQAGTPATFNNTIVSNASSSATATGIKWQSYGFVLRAGQAIPGLAGDKSTNYGNQAVACAGLTLCQVIGGNLTTGETILPGTELTPYRLTSYANTGALGSGDRVCSFMAISPFELPEGSNSWRVSNVVCRLILTVPKVQVLGNDLRVGSSFAGGTSNVNSLAKGMVSDGSASWVEYAITAPRAVTSLASQSGAANGSTAAQAAWSRLTFANTGVLAGCPDGFGCFNAAANLGAIPNVRTAVSTMNNGGAPLARNMGTAPVSVSGGAGTSLSSILAGADMSSFTQSAAIVTTGTITIDQDITYAAGPYANEASMPQLILIGGNININQNVHRVDAWLVASGTINTCGDVAQSAVRDNNCNNQLTVNGPIMASQLLLDRTYRNPSRPQDAAEVLNLRGDAFIWANRMARQNGHWQTVYTTELPPRY